MEWYHMFSDLDWPLTAPCGFVSIRWASYYIFIWNHSTTTENLLQVTWDNIHFVLVDSHCTQLSLPFWGDCGASCCASFSLSTQYTQHSTTAHARHVKMFCPLNLLTRGLPITLSLTWPLKALAYLWKGLPSPSSALWCQYSPTDW